MEWKKIVGLILAGGLSMACPKDPENCGDGVDNDENGQTDCDDDACANVAACNPLEDCNVVGDEDGDGQADCADSDCDADPDCVVLCGNGNIDAGEDCDGANLGGNDCTDAGNFESGTLACDANCEFDTTLCIAPEQENCNVVGDEDNDGDADCADADCAADSDCIETGNCDDGIDNDVDGLLDCLDLAQCAADAACTETGAECQGGIDDDGDGLVDCLDADCAAEPACDNCGNGAIDAGEECDGALFGNATCASETAGALPGGVLACDAVCQIDATGCLAIVCDNDGIVDAGEQCDDTNATNGDGCDSCVFSPDFEQEPNNDSATANNFAALDVLPAGGDGSLHGVITPGTDLDFFTFSLTAGQVVRWETADETGPGSCLATDTVITLFDIDGTTELDTDDEGSLLGNCSLIEFIVPATGIYFMQVEDFFNNTVVDYTLNFTDITPVCGDGIVGFGEGCEPPGVANCDANCQLLVVAGTEPNDDTIPNTGGGNGNDFHNGFCDNGTTACNVANGAQNCVIGTDGILTNTCTPHNDAAQVIANAFNAADGDILISEAFGVAGDEDTFSVTNNGATLVRVTAETFGPGGVGTCVGIDTELNIRDAAGVELANNDDINGAANRCSLVTRGLAPGETLFVHAIDFGDSDVVALYFLQLSFVEVLCNDGLLDAAETCEDGNTTDGDGCSAACQAEPGFICNNGTLPSVCVASCGDNLINSTDVCDGTALGGNDCTDFGLNNAADGSNLLGCLADCSDFDETACLPSTCGNGIVEIGEQCDDINDPICDPATCLFNAVPEVNANDDTIPNTGGGNGNDFHNGFCDNGTTACNVANGAQNCVVGTNGILTTTCSPHNDINAVNADGPFATSGGSVFISAAFEVAGDEDTFAVTNDGTTLVRLTAETLTSVGVGGVSVCVGVDSEINIRNAAGAELANDDDGGEGTCSLETFAIAPGETFFVHTIDFGDSDIEPLYFLRLGFAEVICNDGLLDSAETCEDGNTTDGDGCDSVCQVEPGFLCNNAALPSVCVSSCGDGIVNSTDECDGTAFGGASCTTEGFASGTLACNADCTIDTSGCTNSICGDGIIDGAEQCEPTTVNCDPTTCLFIVVQETEPNDDTIPNTAGGNGNDFHNGFCDNGTTACNVANGAQNCVVGTNGIVTTTCSPHNDASSVLSDTFNTSDGNVFISAAFGVAGDEDTFAVTNDGTTLVRLTAETLTSVGVGGVSVCVGVDSEINIRNAAGAELANDDDGGEGNCSLETFNLLPGETLFVHTIDFLDDGVVASYFLHIKFVEVICNDGLLDSAETCEDGNTTDGDGCSSVCLVEPGFICNNSTLPSVCTPTCGNGTLEAASGEQCDDGNTTDGDGCDSLCQIEGILAETEPNDDGAIAVATNDFDVNNAEGPFDASVVIGASMVAGDDDVFGVTNPTGAPIAFTAETSTDAGGALCAVVSTQLNIRDAAGASLAQSTGEGVGNCSRISFILEPSETLFVHAIELGDNAAIGSYFLRVTFADPLALFSEIEPNEDGTPQTGGAGIGGNDFDATAVTNALANGELLGSTLISGSISAAGDEDVYALTNPGATAVSVDIQVGVPATGACVGADTGINIRNAAGALLVSDDDGNVGVCSYVDNFSLAAGATVFVHLTEFGDNAAIAAYELLVSFQ